MQRVYAHLFTSFENSKKLILERPKGALDFDGGDRVDLR